VAAGSWEAVADAVVAPPACPQPPPSPITPLELNRTSEDCLYLNIFAPEITVNKICIFEHFILRTVTKEQDLIFARLLLKPLIRVCDIWVTTKC
jgi:hypothetical protein